MNEWMDEIELTILKFLILSVCVSVCFLCLRKRILCDIYLRNLKFCSTILYFGVLNE